MKYPALFSPIRIGNVDIPNRIAMAPMTRSTGVNGVVSDAAIGYYRRRAEGGCGLILTEGIGVSAEGSPASNIPELGTQEQIAPWRRITAAVHEAGGRIMAQLWHTGMQRGTLGDWDESIQPVGPSGFFPNRSEDLPPLQSGRTMTDADIDRTIADCARFAENCKDAGFDGVEIHGAHGYLFDQFHWEMTNRRTDRWNGDVAARAGFTAACIKAMRAATGGDYPIGLRFSQWKSPFFYQARPWPTPQDLESFLRPLVDAGCAFFDCSARRYWEPEFEGSDLTFAGWTQKITGVTSLAVGSIGLDGPLAVEDWETLSKPTANLDRLEEMVEKGEVDMIAVGRAFISNPDWANRVRSGDTGTLKPFNIESLATLD